MNIEVSNLEETKKLLISRLSNLTVLERRQRTGGIANMVRRTPRLRPVGPQQAGRGFSSTPGARRARLVRKRK